jgi:hypothetical protein
MLHVLFIGPSDQCNTIRDTFPQRASCRLSVATSYRELFDIPRQESFEIAIIHQMPSLREFCESSAFVRRTWPCAKILVICEDAEVLDDPLYDDWVSPSHSPDVLLATIERLTVSGQRRRRSSRRKVLCFQQAA